MRARTPGTKKNVDRPVDLLPLADSLQPIKDHFNADKGMERNWLSS